MRWTGLDRRSAAALSQIVQGDRVMRGVQAACARRVPRVWVLEQDLRLLRVHPARRRRWPTDPERLLVLVPDTVARALCIPPDWPVGSGLVRIAFHYPDPATPLLGSRVHLHQERR